MADVVEINAKTGEVVERDFTEAELAQREVDAAAAVAAAEAEAQVKARKQGKRQSAVAKLAALGLDEDEVAALIGGE